MLRQIVLLAAAVACGLGPPTFAQSQTSEQKLSFEVASIKLTKPYLPGQLWSGGGRQTSVTGITALTLIRGAFDLHENEVFGAPSWTGHDQFDVNAAFEGERTPARLNAMMRTLLEDRFALKAHHETRELPIYRAVLARKDGGTGPELVRSTLDCQASGRATPCGMRLSRGSLLMGARSVRYFLNSVESFVGRRIVDETGLTGEFDIKLEWSRGPNDATRPEIFTALQEQLGLKLEASRGAVSVLVIDSIERPTPD
jgi:uncharacterized protein (TIGR03435 family)